MNYIRTVVALLLLSLTAIEVSAQWALAEAKSAPGHSAIVFRYLRDFDPGFLRSAMPSRSVLVWHYQSTNGMPLPAEREKMERLEDLVEPAMRKSGVATLVLVSTGEGLREWTYYAKSEELFYKTLNAALRTQAKFPIEIHTGPDPLWSTYDQFRKSIKQ